MRATLSSLHRVVAWIENTLLVLLLSGMMGLGAYQIIARNLFNGGWTESEPLMRVLVLWLGLLGALVAARGHHHISIDLSKRFVNKRWLRPLEIISFGFTAVICFLLMWHSGRFVWEEYQYATPLVAGIPGWVFQIIMPISFGLIALRYLGHAVLGIDETEAT